MAETFTGLKLQGQLGRFGKTSVSDIEGFVQLPDGHGCLWDIEECKLGLTISFKLKIVSIVNGKYYNSNGRFRYAS